MTISRARRIMKQLLYFNEVLSDAVLLKSLILTAFGGFSKGSRKEGTQRFLITFNHLVLFIFFRKKINFLSRYRVILVYKAYWVFRFLQNYK